VLPGGPWTYSIELAPVGRLRWLWWKLTRQLWRRERVVWEPAEVHPELPTIVFDLVFEYWSLPSPEDG
jgi:hypothetical protein